MIKNHFLKTTVFALILSVSSMFSVFATKMTLQNYDWIGEDDTLIVNWR